MIFKLPQWAGYKDRATYGIADAFFRMGNLGESKKWFTVLKEAFPTYPRGFPAEVIAQFAAITGRGVVGNKAASGTAILDELGQHHVMTGDWIVYTSADSVFQVAAHEGVVPLSELYQACDKARAMLQPPHGVSRVIARPFVGQEGAWVRTQNRRDLSLAPPGPTLLDLLRDKHVPRVGVGKVDDLFAGRNILSVGTREMLMSELRAHRAQEGERLAPFSRLTVRECEVLQDLIEGKNADRIATESFVSVATVRSHIKSLLAKLGVNSQLAAVAAAQRAGWISPHTRPDSPS